MHRRIPKYLSTPHGFSLIELAVVLSVIGMMVGGILVGKSMIRSSQMQATVANVEEYSSAIRKFRDIYYALPGDMPNATDLWGAVAGGTCTTPITDTDGDNQGEGTGTQTCNGNGDGRVGHSDLASMTECDGAYWEIFRAWEHLSNAGLVEGEFTGNQGAATNQHSIPGTNVPITPLQPGGYTFIHCGEVSGKSRLFDGQYGHTIIIGGDDQSDPAAELTRYPLFTTEEAGAIDEKFDDSWPHTGKIRAPQKDDVTAFNCSNSTASAPASADYEFTITGRKCALYFSLGF